ncbi:CocE/NonD family hydrolase C-terminal non-catalytic domain-containing protein [Nocardia sp. 852002-20019_SCH5090214]|uniref:CocE/NonD family hydrolase C-terminal non-catalytic domain-containing protein n=1 Tax=Nocardia sp. 852002-20019_SCH5090214 TaxID=1834087 RepID=UPI00351977F9
MSHATSPTASCGQLPPWRIHEQIVDLWSISYVFRAGHRIRVQVTSSNFPRWERNLNIGEPADRGTRSLVAQQEIAHGAPRSSRICCPQFLVRRRAVRRRLWPPTRCTVRGPIVPVRSSGRRRRLVGGQQDAGGCGVGDELAPFVVYSPFGRGDGSGNRTPARCGCGLRESCSIRQAGRCPGGRSADRGRGQLVGCRRGKVDDRAVGAVEGQLRQGLPSEVRRGSIVDRAPAGPVAER